MDHLSELQKQIKPLRDQLREHPLYISIREKEDLQIFMEGHVFAVWDFASLINGLRSRLTHLGDHSGLDNQSLLALLEAIINRGSEGADKPFGLFSDYREAMQRAGAGTFEIDDLVNRVRTGTPPERAILDSKLPGYVVQFLDHTFSILRESNPVVMAATFAFGRGGLIPDIFSRLIDKRIGEGDDSLSGLQAYFDGYIEVGSTENAPLIARLITHLCGDDLNAWSECLRAADDALRARIALWNGIHERMLSRQAILN